MQDNQGHNFDDHIVDQAWENMRMLLDQEMPVASASKRKPVAWWWISTLGLSLFVGALCAYYLVSKSVNLSSFPISIINKPITAHADSNTPNQIVSTTLNPSKKIFAETSSRLNNQTTPVSKTTSLSPKSDIQIPVSINGFDNDLPATILSENLNSTIAPLQDGVVQKDDVPIKHEAFSIAPLAPASSVPATTNSSSSIPEVIAIEPAKAKKSFKLSIEGSMHSVGFQNINGYGAAVMAERHNQGSRLYVKAGLGYDIINPDIIASEQKMVFENTAIYRGSEDNNIISTNTALTSLQKSYISISMGYQLSDKIAIEAGVQPSYIHSSTLQETWSHSGGSSGMSTPFVSRITDNAALVQRKHLVLTSSIQYQFNPSIGLRLNYQHGLSNIFASSYNESNLSGLKVAFAYYIR